MGENEQYITLSRPARMDHFRPPAGKVRHVQASLTASATGGR